MNATVTDNAERLARLETRAEYIDAILDDRQMVISAHSRRLADIEMHLRDHHRINANQTERIARLEMSTELTKEERVKRDHTKALIQWAMTLLVGIGVIVGLLTRGDAATLRQLLGGFVGLP